MSHEDEGHEFWPCSVVGTPRKRVQECITPCKLARHDDESPDLKDGNDGASVPSVLKAMSSAIADLRSDLSIMQGQVQARHQNEMSIRSPPMFTSERACTGLLCAAGLLAARSGGTM